MTNACGLSPIPLRDADCGRPRPRGLLCRDSRPGRGGVSYDMITVWFRICVRNGNFVSFGIMGGGRRWAFKVWSRGSFRF